jgi:hypothetical protein
VKLTPFDIDLLASLPAAPNGLSLHELADGLLDNAGPQARGQVKAAVEVLRAGLGGLHVGRGDDEVSHADVPLYGVPAEHRARVKEILSDRDV